MRNRMDFIFVLLHPIRRKLSNRRKQSFIFCIETRPGVRPDLIISSQPTFLSPNDFLLASLGGRFRALRLFRANLVDGYRLQILTR